MQLKALFITLGILGSSTLALADRGYNSFRRERRVETTWRAHQPSARATTWQPLTSLERLDRRGDKFDLSTRGRFSQLRLQNQSGRTVVRQIEIVFANGERQLVRVGRVLEGNHAMIDIDLDGDGRRIDKIFVDGRSARRGSYQLYAM